MKGIGENMLYLISVGLHDDRDMSLKALETAKGCGRLYLERYTDNISVSGQKLSALVGKEVLNLERKDMEDRADALVREAKSKDVGIFVGGDALSATTHVMILEEARKSGVPVKVIHGSSIITAVAETGLQVYKFGRVVTLTRSFEDSILAAINGNIKAGLHTLVLLDIGMTAREAAGILSRKLSLRAVAACNLGGDDTVIIYGDLDELKNDKSLERTPAIIAIPSKLHFMEEEFLAGLKG